MKRKKMELNKKLVLNKKSIAALKSVGMDQIQGGMRNLTFVCAPSGLRCGATDAGATCASADICASGLAQQCTP